MANFFGALSLIIMIVGLFQASQVTIGVWCAATACYFAILVRLHDATKQHKEAMEANERLLHALNAAISSRNLP